jgi:hypothetical protein
MTNAQIAVIGVIIGMFGMLAAAASLAISTMGSDEAGRRRRLGRCDYALRIICLQIGVIGATITFALSGSSAFELFFAIWIFCTHMTAKWSGKRLNDCGITSRKLAILTGFPGLGFLIAVYLALLPPAEPSPETPR